MENYKALEEIKAFERTSSDPSFSLHHKKKVNAKLPTLGAAMLMGQAESSEAA